MVGNILGWDKMDNLIDIIKDTVIDNVIKRGNGNPGENLSEIKLSIMEFREIFYNTLRDIEIEQIKEKWDRGRWDGIKE